MMDNNTQQLGSVNRSLCHSGFFSRTAPAGMYSGAELESTYCFDMYDLDMKDSKTMWGNANYIETSEHPSLELSLGQLPISSEPYKVSLTAFSNKTSILMEENNEILPFGQGQILQLNLGNKLYTPNALSANAPKSPHVGDIDLNLSLSAASSESAVTSLPTISDQRDGSYESSAGLSLMATNEEEGSASSRWIFGSYPTMSFDNSDKHTITSYEKVYNEADPVLVIPEPPLTMAQTVKYPVACTSGTNHIQRNHCTKKCTIQGCGKGARGASGRCIAHGGGRRCQKIGCQRGAEGKTIYCKGHGGGRRCDHLGCTRSAEGRTDYCIGHGGGRRCNSEGCIHASRGKSGYCIKHGGGKRCQMENCQKSAEGSSGLCISHGGGKRCQHPDCTKGAQGSTRFCKAHGGGKRCTYPECTKGAEGSTLFCKGHGGGKRCAFQGGGICSKSVHGGTQFCVAHGGGKRCAAPECTKSARGRTNFCVRHGGGKRCKYDGCGKSAQGSTDFCKGHGGGRRCAWGQEGSHFGAGDAACDKNARSKSGLCAAHAALVQDSRVHGGGTLGQSAFNHLELKMPTAELFRTSNVLNSGEGSSGCAGSEIANHVDPIVAPDIDSFSLPEGRVRGGGLMAMLRSSVLFVNNAV